MIRFFLAVFTAGWLLISIAAFAQDNATRKDIPELKLKWSLDGFWTGVATDNSGLLFALGKGSCAELSLAGKKVREFKLAGENAQTARLLRLVKGREKERLLLAFSVWGDRLCACDLNGKHLWSYSRSDGIDDVDPYPLLGSAENDVIVGYNGDGGLHVLDFAGKMRWRSNEIGNVWHVTAGDALANGKPQVVTTSAVGQVHIFGSSAESVGEKTGALPQAPGFSRHGSGVQRGGGRSTPGRSDPPGVDAPLAHRRAEYPLSGCVPAEPDSVSSAS